MNQTTRRPRWWPLALLSSGLIAACVVTTEEDENVHDDGHIIEDDGQSEGDDFAPWCFDGDATGGSVEVCDALAVTPKSAGGPADLCSDEIEVFEPYGYTICRLGFEHYQLGHAERLAACVATIEATEACAFEPVQTCLDLTFEEACNSPSADALCLDIFEACADLGESFDFNLCSYELRLFDEGALLAFEDCYAMSPDSCGERYEACFAGLSSLE